MKTSKKVLFGRTISYSCISFSAVILLFSVVISLMLGEKTYGILPSAAIAIFALCFIISAASEILASVRLNTAVKYVIHLAVTVVSSSVVLSISNDLSARTIFLAECALLPIHAALFILVTATSARRAKRKAVSEK